MVRSLFAYLILACSFVANAQESSRFTVQQVQVPINGDIYSPTFKNSSLIVCGNRKDRITHTHLDKNGEEPIDLYVLNPDSAFAYIRFDQKFRSDFHDGPISFNEAGDQCIVSRNLRLDHQFKALQKEDNQLGLFQSQFVNGEWTTPEPLLVNNAHYNCTHPALSANGNTLIFSSNMPGGFGGYDLWKIEKSGDKWGEPENLGSGVNTSGNEFFPTWIGNTIYFSANRKVYGGFDIYQIDGSGESAKAKVLEHPLNSEHDEFGLISNTQGESGYFSSNRNGSDQLWSFEMLFPEFENCDSLVNDDFCYSLVEETAYELGGIESLVYQWDINGVKKYGYEIDYCFPGSGVYDISVNIIDTVVKKTYANQASYTLELSNEEQPYISSPDSIQIGQEFSLDPSKTFLPEVQIDSYYWMISNGALFTIKNPTYSFEKSGVYQIMLGVLGTKNGESFKDCSYKYIVATESFVDIAAVKSPVKPIGALEDNGQILESDRPIPLSDSLTIVHSIEFARSSTPLSDTNEMLTPISDHYIVNTLFDPSDSSYVYSVGQWVKIGDAHEAWVEMVKMGYEDASIFTSKRESLSDLPLNKSFNLGDIQFETDKSEFKEDAEEELKILVLLLKEFKDVNLLISAHTDNVGSSEHNLDLSKRRALAITNYLVKSGLDRNRLKSRGFGESRPKFTNDTPEGRAKNRRVDFKLITSKEVEIILE